MGRGGGSSTWSAPGGARSIVIATRATTATRTTAATAAAAGAATAGTVATARRILHREAGLQEGGMIGNLARSQAAAAWRSLGGAH